MSDIEKVKKLREATGAGFKDCNLAIKESEGDLDKAIEILRVKGISKASKKMSRDAKEGVVVVSGNESKKSVIEVNCETDFVAKNEDEATVVKLLRDVKNPGCPNCQQTPCRNRSSISRKDLLLPGMLIQTGDSGWRQRYKHQLCRVVNSMEGGNVSVTWVNPPTPADLDVGDAERAERRVRRPLREAHVRVVLALVLEAVARDARLVDLDVEDGSDVIVVAGELVDAQDFMLDFDDGGGDIM